MIGAARAALAVVVLVVAPPGRAVPDVPSVRLDVPIVRQAPERCGPAALRMVLAHQGADSAALAQADAAYDPVLRGALVTDLAAAARRAGHPARVATWSTDSLLQALVRGEAPIVLWSDGVGPLQRGHYAVVVGWERERDAFVVHDGRSAARRMDRRALARRWGRGGSQALVVSPPRRESAAH